MHVKTVYSFKEEPGNMFNLTNQIKTFQTNRQIAKPHMFVIVENLSHCELELRLNWALTIIFDANIQLQHFF